MKAWWRWMALLAGWWMLVFLVQRALFLAFALRHAPGIGAGDVLLCQWKGLPLDLSMTGYLLIGSWLLAGTLLFTEVRALRRALVAWHLLLLIVASVVTTADIGLFDAWGSKVDRKALGYLAFPEEAAASVSPGWSLLLLGLAVVQVLVLFRMHRAMDHAAPFTPGPLGGRVASLLLLPVLAFVVARGGPQDDPINKSWAWHSPQAALNLGALNSLWNLLELAVEPAHVDANPYTVLAAEEAAARDAAGRLHAPVAHRSILRTQRPNILLVLLESWTAGCHRTDQRRQHHHTALHGTMRGRAAAAEHVRHGLPHRTGPLRHPERLPRTAHHHHHARVRQVRAAAQPGAHAGQCRILLHLLVRRRP